jgi:heme exporter protein B
MKQLIALMRKDLLLELRGRETLSLMIGLSLLLSVVVACAVQTSTLAPREILNLFPGLIWVVLLFSATVSIGRSYEYEIENLALEGLLLSGASPSLIFVAKSFANFLVILFGQMVSLVLLAVLLNVDVLSAIPGLFLVSALVVGAYSQIATLLAALTSTSRLKSMLLPLLLLPLLFPLFFAAIEVSANLVIDHSLAWDSIWFSLLIALNALYFALGINLYEFVIGE